MKLKLYQKYIYPEKNNMIIQFNGSYELNKDKERIRAIMNILKYNNYPKYPNNIIYLFNTDIKTLKLFKD